MATEARGRVLITTPDFWSDNKPKWPLPWMRKGTLFLVAQET
jgi:hypothetical protein